MALLQNQNNVLANQVSTNVEPNQTNTEQLAQGSLTILGSQNPASQQQPLVDAPDISLPITTPVTTPTIPPQLSIFAPSNMPNTSVSTTNVNDSNTTNSEKKRTSNIITKDDKADE